MSPRPDERFFAVTHFPVDESRPNEAWPSAGWMMIDDLAAAGWSLERLSDAIQYAGTLATDAIMIVQGGREVASWGDITRRFNCHSIRKSFLSALIGYYVEDGSIDLSLTLDALGIDDVEGLSAVEKQATIYDLLTARSGIYHPVRHGCNPSSHHGTPSRRAPRGAIATGTSTRSARSSHSSPAAISTRRSAT
jgi:CubicO group peptidase (beta-lactamase class C family)